MCVYNLRRLNRFDVQEKVTCSESSDRQQCGLQSGFCINYGIIIQNYGENVMGHFVVATA